MNKNHIPVSLPIKTLALCFLLFPLFSFATVRYVPSQYSTIQAAINASVHSDEIIVSPATYKENINFLGKNIILRSTGPTTPSVEASTIIDGNAAGSVVTFSGSESPSCVLAGFTITNGYAYTGGGIRGNGTLATIIHNHLEENTAYGGGVVAGGGGLYDCDGKIEGNIIRANNARYNIVCQGGGLFYCDGLIENNMIIENRCTGEINTGGGLCSCNGTIQNNIISSNFAWGMRSWGGGLDSCSGSIQNNTIYGNFVAQDEGGGLSACNGIIRNCVIWANTAPANPQLDDCSIPSYSCIQGWTGGGTGNISANPQLTNPSNNDFHLLSNSPCIDAGSFILGLNQDFEGDPRPMDGTSEPRGDGSQYDIGADEYPGPIPPPTPTPTPTPTPSPSPIPTPSPTPTSTPTPTPSPTPSPTLTPTPTPTPSPTAAPTPVSGVENWLNL